MTKREDYKGNQAYINFANLKAEYDQMFGYLHNLAHTIENSSTLVHKEIDWAAIAKQIRELEVFKKGSHER